ncbi:MauE/DoxX family redox-associated membrane protein [Sphaerisporangium perillae]|uniref:MauE/DoxX family redox-associated membrane protein n=1 Tax=Sphaerisporangium perillae TaxID=2935860 RepID=UPI00200BB487|nr:MauE/DoxX family redox-associated membrane protein [Sphaerisporangium perillae]
MAGYVEIGCQVLLAAVFGWSAVSKLASRTAFRRFARSLEPLVRRTTPVAAALVAGELLTPPLTLLAPLAGFALASGMLAVLSAGVLTVVRRGLAVRCRCFGSGDARLGPRHVVRNLILLAIGVLGLLLAALPAASPADAAGVALAAVAGLAVAGLVIRFEDLVELFA